MISFNRNLYPSSGYVFTDKDGSRHRAEGWRSLERKVAAYRTRNGMVVGDVWQDIMDQICAAIPGHCNDNSPRAIPVRTPNNSVGRNRANLAARVLTWIGWVLKERRDRRLTKVDRKEAVRRAKICLACPMQTPLTSGCPTCSGTIATGRKAIMSGEPYAEPKLDGCSALVEDTRISVHLQLSPSINPDLPGPCWRKVP